MTRVFYSSRGDEIANMTFYQDVEVERSDQPYSVGDEVFVLPGHLLMLARITAVDSVPNMANEYDRISGLPFVYTVEYLGYPDRSMPTEETSKGCLITTVNCPWLGQSKMWAHSQIYGRVPNELG
jgi:hypothetical protein